MKSVRIINDANGLIEAEVYEPITIRRSDVQGKIDKLAVAKAELESRKLALAEIENEVANYESEISFEIGVINTADAAAKAIETTQITGSAY